MFVLLLLLLMSSHPVRNSQRSRTVLTVSTPHSTIADKYTHRQKDEPKGSDQTSKQTSLSPGLFGGNHHCGHAPPSLVRLEQLTLRDQHDMSDVVLAHRFEYVSLVQVGRNDYQGRLVRSHVGILCAILARSMPLCLMLPDDLSSVYI